MAIQWFPGHMTSAKKKATETMERIDVVIEVLDARVPEAGSNPMIREMREFRQRPCLKILNKADLADPAARPSPSRARNRARPRRYPSCACRWRRTAAPCSSRCA
jgi:ribosome biogenesis GTPase A